MHQKLTDRELMCIEDSLKANEMVVQKFRHWAGEVKDSQLKKLLEDQAAIHSKHYEILVQELGDPREVH